MSDTEWEVLAPRNLRNISMQSGAPVHVLAMSVDRLLPIGTVTAETKGAAVMRAHEAYPRVPVADLSVRRKP